MAKPLRSSAPAARTGGSGPGACAGGDAVRTVGAGSAAADCPRRSGRGSCARRLVATMLAVLALALPAAAQEEEGDPVVGQGTRRRAVRRVSHRWHRRRRQRRRAAVPGDRQRSGHDADRAARLDRPGAPGAARPGAPPQQIADINAYLDALHEAPAEAEPPRVETEEPPPALEQSPPEELGEPIEPSDFNAPPRAAMKKCSE